MEEVLFHLFNVLHNCTRRITRLIQTLTILVFCSRNKIPVLLIILGLVEKYKLLGLLFYQGCFLLKKYYGMVTFRGGKVEGWKCFQTKPAAFCMSKPRPFMGS